MKIKSPLVLSRIRDAFIEELARFMHEAYEEEAIFWGWATQEKPRVPFEKLPEANKNIMLGVAEHVLEWFQDREVYD